MALLNICSVFDKQAEAFGRPIFVPAKGLAIRSFIDEVNREDAQNSMYMHPDDYILYYLGDFDDGDGSFKTDTGHTVLMTGTSAKDVK